MVAQIAMFFSFLCFWPLTIPQEGFSASLPTSKQEILQKLKLNSSFLADIGRELKVPHEWIEKAKREGKLRLRTTR